MTLLLARESRAFEEYTRPLQQPARQSARVIQEGLQKANWGRLEPVKPSITRYLEYLRWPARRMEYSYALRALGWLAGRSAFSRVLDVGSGPSPFPTVLSAAFGCPVWSVDRDPQVVEAMRLLAPPGCTYEVSDMSALPHGDHSFDAVTCISVLEHVPRSAGIAAVAEMLRVVKENGVVVLTVDYCSLAAGWQMVKWLNRAATAGKRLAAGRVKALVAEVAVPGAYDWAQIGSLHDRFGELAVNDPDAGWARLSLEGIRSFWREHWEPGFSYERSRGRDYTSVGMMFSPDPRVRSGLSQLEPGGGRPWV